MSTNFDARSALSMLADACITEDFPRWVLPRLRAIEAALDERDALKAEKDAWQRQSGNHWETLRSIRDIARTSGDIPRIIQWVNDAGGGYTESNEATMAKLMDQIVELKAELEAARKQEPFVWLAKQHFTGELEFSEPNEKATNPHYWSDAFPLYTSPLPAQQAATVRGIDLMTDDDIWHVAGIVRRLCNGSLYDVSQRDLVLEVRASFEDPDTAYAMLFSVPKDTPCTEQ